MGLDRNGLNLAIEIDGTELGNSAVENTNLLSHLAVEHAVGGVHHHNGLRNIFTAIVDKAVEIEALAHVPKEILLRPSPKHGRRQHRSGCPVVGGQEWRLVPALAELACTRAARRRPVIQRRACVVERLDIPLPRTVAAQPTDEVMA
jgi:hypothetical protein